MKEPSLDAYMMEYALRGGEVTHCPPQRLTKKQRRDLSASPPRESPLFIDPDAEELPNDD